MIEININISPEEIGNELREETKEITTDLFRLLKFSIPKSIRDLMDSSAASGKLYARSTGAGFSAFHQASAKGQVPAKDTFELYNSLQGIFSDENSVEIEIAEHAKWLDPLLDGYLNRPFIEEGIEMGIDYALPKI